MKLASLYESITASIIAELEQGCAPWAKVWDSQAGGFLPANAATRRYYNGINIPILWGAASRHAYPTHEWMTFKQALELNACVRKGEKGTSIVFVKKLIREEENHEPKSLTVLKQYSVFNVAQIDGLIPAASPLDVVREPPNERVEAFVKSAKVGITHGPYEPCYIPSQDSVCLPAREAFNGDEHYYATLLHECVHWSGAKHRLDRQLHNRFGTKDYAAEELVAELGAAFLCAHLGVRGELRHAGYIKTWLSLLREDPRAIFTASAKASEAANYLRAFSEPAEIVDEGLRA